MPSRITQKSTRPRASDRSMCCHEATTTLASFKAESTLSRFDKHAAEMESRDLRWIRESRKPKPDLFNSGLEAKEPTYLFQSREKMSLTIPSYRAGVIAQNP